MLLKRVFATKCKRFLFSLFLFLFLYFFSSKVFLPLFWPKKFTSTVTTKLIQEKSAFFVQNLSSCFLTFIKNLNNELERAIRMYNINHKINNFRLIKCKIVYFMIYVYFMIFLVYSLIINEGSFTTIVRGCTNNFIRQIVYC